ncbi:hypothetical protein SAMN05216311_103169 [Chitinophaga sp. CF418]|nr:hypothetical protein SAMN05216311_103169 [Chitinophaga sp. CF418]
MQWASDEEGICLITDGQAGGFSKKICVPGTRRTGTDVLRSTRRLPTIIGQGRIITGVIY